MVSQPKAPDPYNTAAAQQSANIGASQASAIINNANETNPYGSVKYDQSGYETIYDAKGKPQQVPRYNRTVSLSPEQQQLLNKQNQMQNNLADLGVSQSSRLQGLLGQEMNTEGLQDWDVAARPEAYDRDAYSADRSKVEKALYDRYKTQADPQRQAQEASLAARGLAPGSQNWGAQQDAMNRADTDANYAAIAAGGAEQSRLLQEERSGWDQGQQYTEFLNNLRGAQFGERTALRNQPINEISALASGSQVTAPQFQPFSRQGVDAAPIGQYIQDNYAQKVNAASATNQGIFGLAGAGLKLASGMPFFGSDRRLKFDIKPLGQKLAGLPLYFFRFLAPLCFHPLYAGQQVGVMSDEVRKLHPDAVIVSDEGFDMVDYGKLLRRH